MKSITIHNMDDSLASLIDTVAKNRNMSINKTIKMLLGKALGVTVDSPKVSDFSQFCGVWTEEDKTEFDSAVADFETIDESDWE